METAVTQTELEQLNAWMREPDHAEEFSLADAIDWMNRRPIATVLKLLGGYPSQEAMNAAVELEIESAIGRVKTVAIGKMIQRAIDVARH